jgi:hypothetical protein
MRGSTGLSWVAENSNRWPRGGNAVQQPGDRGQKAHVGHVVGLVEDGGGDRVQRVGPLTQQVQQPPGCGHDDVDATPELSAVPRVEGTPSSAKEFPGVERAGGELVGVADTCE